MAVGMQMLETVLQRSYFLMLQRTCALILLFAATIYLIIWLWYTATENTHAHSAAQRMRCI